MDDQLSNNEWSGEIALFPISSTSLAKVQKISLGFSDLRGTPYDSCIAFVYCPRKLEPAPKPYVVLNKSEIPSHQRGKGYNQFTRKCFIDFVKKHTDAELIISDARADASLHILTKPEFGFQNGKKNNDLLPYSKGMTTPYYLMINR